MRAYEAAGVPICGLTIQNEPQNRTPSGYPGTDLPTRQAIAGHRQARARAAGRRASHTKILGYDHNWSEHPNDIANTPPGDDPETEYPTLLLESDAAQWIDGTAYHCYAGDQKRMTALHQAFPDKPIWFTECSGSHGPTDPPAQVFSDTLKWHARNVTIGPPRNWAQSVVTWNLALHADGGRTTAAATPARVSSPSTPTAPSPATRSTTRSATSPGSCGPERSGSPARPTAARLERPSDERGLRQPRRVDGAGGAQRVRRPAHASRSRSATDHFDYTLPGGSLVTFTWPHSADLTNG